MLSPALGSCEDPDLQQRTFLFQKAQVFFPGSHANDCFLLLQKGLSEAEGCEGQDRQGRSGGTKHYLLQAAAWGLVACANTAFLSARSFPPTAWGPHSSPTHTDPSKFCLGGKQTPLAPHLLHQAGQRGAEQSSLAPHLPAVNLLPKIAAEPRGILMAATQPFSVLKGCKENLELLACVQTGAVLPGSEGSAEQ